MSFRTLRITRRHVLGGGLVAAAGLALETTPLGDLTQLDSREGDVEEDALLTPLEPDPGGLLDLPPGFQYRVVSEAGRPLSGGATVPGDFDGMAAFAGAGGATVLVRNHELEGAGGAVSGRRPYNRDEPGGTIAIVLDADRRPLREFVTSSGTRNNCAGGATPWGTWITCEEDHTSGHGYAFEVDPSQPESPLSRLPIKEMGHFCHEAVAIDPRTGVVYLTEDGVRLGDQPAFLYRFTPVDRRQRPGALHRGGTLEALALEARPAGDTETFGRDRRYGVIWRRVDPADPNGGAVARGCARFRRLEGCCFAGGALWFDDTEGGQAKLGQIFRYRPETETIELFYEATTDGAGPLMDRPDNAVVTPFGDVWFCTDSESQANHVVGITPAGGLYRFARNRLNDSELAGLCFSPDGGTLFVNVQEPGLTLAVWGPFGALTTGSPPATSAHTARSAGRRRLMAMAPPPPALAPRLTAATLERSERHGLAPLEAAAYERLGVVLA